MVTTRSRTLLFLSYRDSNGNYRKPRNRYNYTDRNEDTDDQEREGLISRGDSHVALDMENALPPKWVDLSDQVHFILTGTREKITALDKLHAKHVLPGFADRTAEEREIELLTNDITREFRQCSNIIQKIADTAHTFPPSSSGSNRNESLTAQNVQKALAAKVQDLSSTFRKKQRVYMQKLQGHAIKNQDLLVASGATHIKGSDSISAMEEDVEASRSQLSAQEQLDPDLARRNHEITEIAKSIASLADLFKDLSALVIDQGTILDSVEYNVEQTALHVQEAVKELEQATRYQRNTGRRKCIFLLLLLILGLIVVLIFKPRRYSNPASSPPSLGTSRIHLHP